MKIGANHASLQLIRTIWGVPLSDRASWKSFLETLPQNGNFAGIEMCSPGPFFPFAQKENDLIEFQRDFKFDLVMQVHTLDYPVRSASVKEHVKSLREKILQSLKFNPVMINCHAGKDSFSLDDIAEVIQCTKEIESETGIPIVHETHRQRMLYSPFVIRDLVKYHPRVCEDIKLNADHSHFVVGLERCPSNDLDGEFWPQVLELIASRAWYIHARVATAQQIQVAHPDDPQVQGEVKSHMHWWSVIAKRMVAEGRPLRVCPEFGPVPYTPVAPFSQAPLADLNEVVLKFAERLRQEL